MTPAAIAHFRCDEFFPRMLRINPRIGRGIVMRGNIQVINKLITPKTKAVTGAFSLSVNEFRIETINHERMYPNPSSILPQCYYGAPDGYSSEPYDFMMVCQAAQRFA